MMKGMGQIALGRPRLGHTESIIKLFRTFISENPEIWTDELQREIYVACSTVLNTKMLK